MSHRKLYTLGLGESGFVLSHACIVVHDADGEHMYVDANSPLRSEGGGTAEVRIVRFPCGKVAVDLSDCEDRRFAPSTAGWSRGFELKRVDVLLQPPPRSPDDTYLCHMERATAGFIKPSEAWLFNGHMWVDGWTKVSARGNDEQNLRIVRAWTPMAQYYVDQTYCPGALFNNEWPSEDPRFPIQIARDVTHTRYKGL